MVETPVCCVVADLAASAVARALIQAGIHCVHTPLYFWPENCVLLLNVATTAVTKQDGGGRSDRHKYDDEAGDSDDGPGPEDSDFEDEEVDEDGAFDSADEAR